MKYYAVIDTNVIVSAVIKSSSIPGTILDLAFNGIIVPLYNEDILAEYELVLSRSKFGLTSDVVRTIVDSIEESGIFITAEGLDIQLPDMNDLVFYEVIMEGRKTKDAFLVTGNTKHFPVETFIVTPRQMLDIILKDAE